uniref:Reverse transcriptase domain-containing protein n=1 Tax=Syphacia muris TaxID=451379 RepID=A0A0N5AML4_9BILA
MLQNPFFTYYPQSAFSYYAQRPYNYQPLRSFNYRNPLSYTYRILNLHPQQPYNYQNLPQYTPFDSSNFFYYNQNYQPYLPFLNQLYPTKKSIEKKSNQTINNKPPTIVKKENKKKPRNIYRSPPNKPCSRQLHLEEAERGKKKLSCKGFLCVPWTPHSLRNHTTLKTDRVNHTSFTDLSTIENLETTIDVSSKPERTTKSYEQSSAPTVTEIPILTESSFQTTFSSTRPLTQQPSTTTPRATTLSTSAPNVHHNPKSIKGYERKRSPFHATPTTPTTVQKNKTHPSLNTNMKQSTISYMKDTAVTKQKALKNINGSNEEKIGANTTAFSKAANFDIISTTKTFLYQQEADTNNITAILRETAELAANVDDIQKQKVATLPRNLTWTLVKTIIKALSKISDILDTAEQLEMINSSKTSPLLTDLLTTKATGELLNITEAYDKLNHSTKTMLKEISKTATSESKKISPAYNRLLEMKENNTKKQEEISNFEVDDDLQSDESEYRRRLRPKQEEELSYMEKIKKLKRDFDKNKRFSADFNYDDDDEGPEPPYPASAEVEPHSDDESENTKPKNENNKEPKAVSCRNSLFCKHFENYPKTFQKNDIVPNKYPYITEEVVRRVYWPKIPESLVDQPSNKNKKEPTLDEDEKSNDDDDEAQSPARTERSKGDPEKLKSAVTSNQNKTSKTTKVSYKINDLDSSFSGKNIIRNNAGVKPTTYISSTPKTTLAKCYRADKNPRSSETGEIFKPKHRNDNINNKKFNMPHQIMEKKPLIDSKNYNKNTNNLIFPEMPLQTINGTSESDLKELQKKVIEESQKKTATLYEKAVDLIKSSSPSNNYTKSQMLQNNVYTSNSTDHGYDSKQKSERQWKIISNENKNQKKVEKLKEQRTSNSSESSEGPVSQEKFKKSPKVLEPERRPAVNNQKARVEKLHNDTTATKLDNSLSKEKQLLTSTTQDPESFEDKSFKNSSISNNRSRQTQDTIQSTNKKNVTSELNKKVS